MILFSAMKNLKRYEADVPISRKLNVDPFIGAARRFLGTILLGLTRGMFFLVIKNVTSAWLSIRTGNRTRVSSLE